MSRFCAKALVYVNTDVLQKTPSHVDTHTEASQNSNTQNATVESYVYSHTDQRIQQSVNHETAATGKRRVETGVGSAAASPGADCRAAVASETGYLQEKSTAAPEPRPETAARQSLFEPNHRRVRVKGRCSGGKSGRRLKQQGKRWGLNVLPHLDESVVQVQKRTVAVKAAPFNGVRVVVGGVSRLVGLRWKYRRRRHSPAHFHL